MDRYQAPRDVGPDLRSILFDTRHQNLLETGCFAWEDLNCEVIEILWILQNVPDLFEGTVYAAVRPEEAASDSNCKRYVVCSSTSDKTVRVTWDTFQGRSIANHEDTQEDRWDGSSPLAGINAIHVCKWLLHVQSRVNRLVNVEAFVMCNNALAPLEA